ncbi:tryptophan synthase subunit alpha [Streptomyces sp. NPDC050204]|uniref:tryptophan synthase subunit alpha n=1 Tax=Streptomyces sp. NPDC050204 TaxID=3155514 RepID=UPI0034350ECE
MSARVLAGPALTPAARWLTRQLTQYAPQLGVFLPAGCPSARTDVAALRLFADRGAGILEIGIPHRDAVFDGPLIQDAYRQALRQGIGVADVLETVSRAATLTAASVVVMTYWEPVHAYGPARFAQALATAGAAGAMIVDLPSAEAAAWLASARAAGIHTPQLVSRAATDQELNHLGATATGWLYAPAAEALTGYTGDLDVPALHAFTHRLYATGSAPVVTGIGISTPEKARSVRHLVNGVVVGTPVVRPLLELGGSEGLSTAAGQVEAFSRALRS